MECPSQMSQGPAPMGAETKVLTYDAAMAELERLVGELQSPQCEVDRLCELTKRAIELLKFCKEKLNGTDQELAALLEKLED